MLATASVLICCEGCSSYVAAAVCTSICFELCRLIVGESFFPAHPAERCALHVNGKVKVMLLTMCSQLISVQSSDGTRKRTHLRHSTRAVLTCLAGTHAYVGCPDGNWSCSWGVAGDRERVWPLFDVLADVETEAFGLVLAL